MDSISEKELPKIVSNESNTSATNIFSNKNTMIILLIFLLILSFLGINIFIIFGDFFQRVSNVFGPFFINFLSLFGYTTGTVIDKSADVVGDASKTGIDIFEGVAHSIASLFLKASDKTQLQQPQPEAPSQPEPEKKVPEKKAPEKKVSEEPKPDTTKNPIQKPISSIKSRWCLVGEYEGRRGCIEIADSDKCLSGQVFPTQQLCLNPTYTSNMPFSLKPVPE